MWALIFALVLLIPAAVSAQTPADAVADVVANSGDFPAGTTVVSVTVDGASAVVDLSAEALSAGFDDTQSDAMVKAIANALGEFPEINAIEVTVGGQPTSTYLPPYSGAEMLSGGSVGSMSVNSVGGGYHVQSAQDPLVPPVVAPLTGELAGKLVVLHPSHGAYASATSWYRAQRTYCGPNPSPPRPSGWTGSVYQPSNYYYWTMGFQFPSYYEDDMSPETIRFLYAYCQSAGAATFCSRDLDKTPGNNFDYAGYGYPAPPTSMRPLPMWMTAAKYSLQERGGIPSTVWNTTDVSGQSNIDVRARPYYANWLMQTLGYDKTNSVSFSLHSNAAGVGQARGTETYWYVFRKADGYASDDPYGVKTLAIAYCNAVETGVINAIRNQYDGYWGGDMYPKVTPNPPEFPSSSGTYRGYVQDGDSVSRWQDRGVKTTDFGEIRNARMPAQLMELLFHDDWKFYPDMAFHEDRIFRATVAWGMYAGICNYFGVTPKPRLDASVDSVIFPTLVGPNVAVSGTVSMKNLGQAWCWGDKWVTMVYAPYTVWKLAATADDQFGAAGTKIAIANDGNYYPGDTAAFDVSLTSPATTGLYTTAWQMLKDDGKGGSFGDIATAQIQVDADGPAITIDSPTASDYPYGQVSVQFSAADALSDVTSITADVDGVAVTDGQTVSGLALGAHTLTVTAVDTFGNSGTESVTFNVVNSVGKVTIGGWIELLDNKGTCGFNCEYVAGADAPTGHLTYQDHDTGMTVQSMNMVAMGIVGNQAWFYGTCTVEGEAGHWFRVDVTDNGEPGCDDVFNIQLDTGYSKGGTLGGGNVTIH